MAVADQSLMSEKNEKKLLRIQIKMFSLPVTGLNGETNAQRHLKVQGLSGMT